MRIVVLLALGLVLTAAEPTPSQVLAAHGALLAGPVAEGSFDDATIAAALHHQAFGLDAPRVDLDPRLLQPLMEAVRDGEELTPELLSVLNLPWFEYSLAILHEPPALADAATLYRKQFMHREEALNRARVVGLTQCWLHAPFGRAKARWSSILSSMITACQQQSQPNLMSQHAFAATMIGSQNGIKHLLQQCDLNGASPEARRATLSQFCTMSAWMRAYIPADTFACLRFDKHTTSAELAAIIEILSRSPDGVYHSFRETLLHCATLSRAAPPPALIEAAQRSGIAALLLAHMRPQADDLKRVVAWLLTPPKRLGADWLSGAATRRNWPVDTEAGLGVIAPEDWRDLWMQPAWQIHRHILASELEASWAKFPSAMRCLLLVACDSAFDLPSPILEQASTDADPRVRMLAADAIVRRDLTTHEAWLNALIALSTDDRQACWVLIHHMIERCAGLPPDEALPLLRTVLAMIPQGGEPWGEWWALETLTSIAARHPQADIGAEVKTAIADRCRNEGKSRWSGNLVNHAAAALDWVTAVDDRTDTLAHFAPLHPLLHADLLARWGQAQEALERISELEDDQKRNLPRALLAAQMALNFEAALDGPWNRHLWQPWRGSDQAPWSRPPQGFADPPNGRTGIHEVISARLSGARVSIDWPQLHQLTDPHKAVLALADAKQLEQRDGPKIRDALLRDGQDFHWAWTGPELVAVLRTLNKPAHDAPNSLPNRMIDAETLFQDCQWAAAAEQFAIIANNFPPHELTLNRCALAHILSDTPQPIATRAPILATSNEGRSCLESVARWLAARGRVTEAKDWLSHIPAAAWQPSALKIRIALAHGNRAEALAAFTRAMAKADDIPERAWVDTFNGLIESIDDPTVREWAGAARVDPDQQLAQVTDWLGRTQSAALRRRLVAERSLIHTALGDMQAAMDGWVTLSADDDWWGTLAKQAIAAQLNTAPSRMLLAPNQDRAIDLGAYVPPWTPGIGLTLDPVKGAPLARQEQAMLVGPDGHPFTRPRPRLLGPYAGNLWTCAGWRPALEPGAYLILAKIDSQSEQRGFVVLPIEKPTRPPEPIEKE
ncbi:MAG: hypothetical protein PF961_21415 [Planctomycetota bacterium]|jgi:hypothetical protein|nr:hypothetical protein [Planctomycetota bacterium]